MEGWWHGLWRGEPIALCLAGYHTLQPDCFPVCSCSLLTKGLCLSCKRDELHSILSPADIHLKIKVYSLMKKQWQYTEHLSMPHWPSAIRNLEILVWFQSSCTNAHAKSQSVCLSCPYIVLFHDNPSLILLILLSVTHKQGAKAWKPLISTCMLQNVVSASRHLLMGR